jgi:hypothetical protein
MHSPTTNQQHITLYNDFTTFSDYCAFLCDAILGLLSLDYEPDGQSIAGAHRSLMDWRMRAEALRMALKAIGRI